ncbi:hypothetical protein FW320_06685 [Azospirillum sp. Vi22]|uniref:hypothetical protein n=1 Tax=Azospirillum baldaniorum TaxID=1064539 RepID=UPI00157B1A84|nr:hypothetical protein [Azospirillum baldaniorum]NUB05862.1 hypothetical protein [Azospirillum baldaniorum]
MSLLSRCNLSLNDFVPVSNVEPATRNVVRVSIEPARPNENPQRRRLNVTMSGNVAEQIGAEVGKTCITAYMAPTPPFVLLRTETLAQAKTSGAPIYKLGRAGKTEEALSHITCTAPFWTEQEKRTSIEPKAFEIRDGALIIELPDSFIRPEYLTGMEVAAAGNQRDLNPPLAPPLGIEPVLVDPPHIPSIFSHPQDGGVVQGPAQTEVEATPPPPDETIIRPDQTQSVEAHDHQAVEVATEVPGEAEEPEELVAAHISGDDTGLQVAEHCIPEPAPEPEKVSVPPTLEDRLYTHLLQLAREGKPCPDNQALATHVNSNPNSVSATLSMMKSRGRVSVCYVSAEGERRDDVVRGWQRAYTMLADKVTTAAPRPANVVEADDTSPVESPAAPPPKAVAPAAPPRRVPVTPSKGRQLSEAELELQEVVGARKPVAAATDVDADFEYLRDKKVPVVRVSSNKTHPFRLNDRPATAAEITARAARVRQISGGR